MPDTLGDRTRRSILAAAVDLSSAQGLAGLSIGGLARAIGMSKSGLYAHFGAKEALQLAAVDFASEGYERDVIAPADSAEPGLPRLRSLMAHWVAYIEGSSYRGGCFFYAASSEFGSRPGRLRDRLARLSKRWIERLEEQARLAVRLGELESDSDPALLAFKLHAYVGEANWTRELLDDPHSFQRARVAIEEALAHAGARANNAGDTP